MFYFREEELQRLGRFLDHPTAKAMAIYGRRRTGKTRLITEFMQRNRSEEQERTVFLYFQCMSYDYHACLADFLSEVGRVFPEEPYLSTMTSFKDAINLLTSIHREKICIIIDEYPFLAKKREDTNPEFQWIIDHGLHGQKLILLGSNHAFMAKQIQQVESPLYGRFDEIVEIRPFSFQQIHELFPVFEDAVQVFSMTGGVAQYVNFFLDYPSVQQAAEALFFMPDGRLIREAPNLLLQELRDSTTYERILRAIGGGEKNNGQIAIKSGLDGKGLNPYINRLQELQLVSPVANPLSSEKRNQRYRINDALFRFHYTFIEPNMSMINAIREKSVPYILGNQYQEFLGITYEDIIRSNCWQYALEQRLPFMPKNLGKWWGPIRRGDGWIESEIDVIAYDEHHLLVGECKYRNKAIGLQELDDLKLKAQFVPSKGRELCYLLAGRSGFTEELKSIRSDHLILIEQS